MKNIKIITSLILMLSICSCTTNVNYNHEKDVSNTLLTYELKKEIKDDYKVYIFNKHNEKIDSNQTYIANFYGIFGDNAICLGISNEYLTKKLGFTSGSFGKFLDFWILSCNDRFIGIHYQNNFYSIQEAYYANYITYNDVSVISKNMDAPDWNL